MIRDFLETVATVIAVVILIFIHLYILLFLFSRAMEFYEWLFG